MHDTVTESTTAAPAFPELDRTHGCPRFDHADGPDRVAATSVSGDDTKQPILTRQARFASVSRICLALKTPFSSSIDPHFLVTRFPQLHFQSGY
jgi:hypothetical protein